MINFLSNNLVTDSNISVVTGTTNAQFPLTNIQAFFTTKVGRVTVAGGIAVIRIDLNRAEDFNTIALVPNNLTGFGYTSPQVRFSTTTTFTGTKVDIALDTKQGWGYLSTTQTGIRFVEMTFTAGTFADISKIYIGNRTVLASTVGFALDGFQREIRRNDDITTNSFGQRFANVRNSQVYYTGTLPFISATDLVTVQELYDLHGRHTPVWLLFDEDNKLLPDGFDTLSGYFYFDNTFAHDVVGGGPYFNVPVQLVEAT